MQSIRGENYFETRKMNASQSVEKKAREGAHNLLVNCAAVVAGERVLILCEDAGLGWYETDVAKLVAQVATEMGAEVELRQTEGPDNGFVDDSEASQAKKAKLMDGEFDCCIFFARIGDQLRFDREPTKVRRVMSYVSSLAELASDYGRIEYQAMSELKHAINTVLLNAGEVSISCSLGSDLRGQMSPAGGNVTQPDDVTVLRFPVGVHAPIDASGFSGELKLARYLTPTGSRVYEPASIALDEVVGARVEHGRVTAYEGKHTDVSSIRAHYDHVAQMFSLDADALLSWHAGIHPGSQYFLDAAADPDRWSNKIFTNPRFVHFHTCGIEAPGEICWMVLDPTICVDREPLWKVGELQLEYFAETRACISRWPSLQRLFAAPNVEIGLLDKSIG